MTSVSSDFGTISYDENGFPTTYNGNALTWDDRKLASYGDISFTYNSAGIRTSKTVNDITYNYILDGTRVLEMAWGNNLA